MKRKRISALCMGIFLSLALCGCVDQHPEETVEEPGESEEVRIVATSPAIIEICDKLDLDLVGVCSSESYEIPERYSNAEEVGTAMSPDCEIIKSLDPDWVLSPTTLESDLQPEFAAIQTKSAFLNLKSVAGMYKSIEELGELFDREEEAAALIDEYESFMAEYKQGRGDSEQPTVLVLMGLPGSYIVATESSYVGSLVKLAGGINVYGDGDGEEFLSANTEDMQTKNPDIIVRCAHALPDEVAEMFAEEFEENDIWKHFDAVTEGRVYDLSYDYFGMSAGFDYQQALEELEPILYGES